MTASPSAASRATLRDVVAGSRTLLVGFGILMLGDGLQGTLLPVRASLEAFPTAITGLVMSTFYLGFLAGSLLAPRVVQSVGHVRAFAAFASLASAAILGHAVFVLPGAWSLLRLFSGFCFAGLYVVAESWLNERATNETRGQLLSVYMVVTYVGVAAGQLLLNAADPRGYDLFVLVSVLISVALVPLLLAAGPSTQFSTPRALALRELYRISPLGVVGVGGSGVVLGALFGMGPVYAESTGLSLAQISFFMTAAVLGCVLWQWPIGHLSDRWDRRRVLTATTFLAAAAALAAIPLAAVSTQGLLVVVFLFGGLSLPLYALAVAHANDFLEPEQMVAASGGLVLVSGVGAVLGPLGASLVMTAVGTAGFFWSLAAVHGAVGAFALYRIARRRAKPLEEQGHYVAGYARGSSVAVDWSQHAAQDRAE